MAARREACGLFHMSELPPETISAALVAYVIHRQAKCEARVEDIAKAMKLPERKRKRGRAVLRVVDRGRADQFLSAVRPLPSAERAIVAMGVVALATHAISRRGRLIRTPRE